MNSDCDVELRGATANDILAEYVTHALTCMQRAAPIQIEDLLRAVTLA